MSAAPSAQAQKRQTLGGEVTSRDPEPYKHHRPERGRCGGAELD